MIEHSAKSEQLPEDLRRTAWSEFDSNVTIFDRGQPQDLAEAARLGDWNYLSFVLQNGRRQCPLGLRSYAAQIILGEVERPRKKPQKLMNLRYVRYAMDVHDLEGAMGRDAAVEAVAKKYRITTRTVRNALHYANLRRTENGTYELVSYELPAGAFPWILRSSFFPWDGWRPEPYGAWTAGAGGGLLSHAALRLVGELRPAGKLFASNFPEE